jgi:hypothetical protein
MFNDNNFFGGSAGGGGGNPLYDYAIDQSLRFNDNDSAYLTRTPASAGNLTTWTYSTWVKRGNVGGIANALLSSATTNDGIYISSNSNLVFYTNSNYYAQTAAVFRDASAWYHIVCVWDTTNATSADRIRIYVNGERQSVAYGTEAALNATSGFNNNVVQAIGRLQYSSNGYHDGYLAEVNFIDGTALDATSFGEFKSGVWIPKAYEGSYGTNGFYLPFEAGEGIVDGNFNAVTYTGNGSTQSITGVGFEPDLVWIKERSSNSSHALFDSVRGATKTLFSDTTQAESTTSTQLTSFDTDGFTTGSSGGTNESGQTYVAWCWDAGTGSPVSNTDGSITSTVKASTDYGFSIVSYTFDSSKTNDVGHGLNQAPEFIIMKSRTTAYNWDVYHPIYSGSNRQTLNTTDAETSGFWQSDPDATKFYVSSTDASNGDAMIAYCFHSVSGYSKIGSYTGTGASGNTVTTGFKPAFVMIKCTTTAGSNWLMFDTTRDPTSPMDFELNANNNNQEYDNNRDVAFSDTGFTPLGNFNINGSGDEYIYMAFADQSVSYPLESDFSGNNNDFTAKNLANTDVVLDSPTNNFATLNPLHFRGACTFSNGNLQSNIPSGTSATGTVTATIAIESGKYYWELTGPSSSYYPDIGVVAASIGNNSMYTRGTGGVAYSYYDGQKFVNGSSSSYGASFTYTDVMGVALDVTSGTITFYKNNVSQGAITLPSGYTAWYPAVTTDTNAIAMDFVVNFGQDSSFAGNKTPQGNTDANGYGDFYYAPPSGYLALCTANLPDPVASIDPAQDGSPQDHFNTVLYTGIGGTQSVTGVGFQPDFVWFKRRSASAEHSWHDVVRGVSKIIGSDNTNAEIDRPTYVTSFDSDGFSFGDNVSNYNSSGSTYVAWNWKANGSGVSNTDGSITSTVSANTDAGFSIVSYTGTGANATVGHGLDSAPDFTLIKNRDVGEAWFVFHSARSGERGILDTRAFAASTSYYTSDPTDTVLNLSGATANVNGNGDDHIAYCFHSVDGFSKFGSYTANGSTDGPFIYTGFRPAFVLIKCTTLVTDWRLIDAARKEDVYGGNDGTGGPWLFPNLSAAESLSRVFDFTSNGFKLQANNGDLNFSSGDTYIYMAFAENPFKYANAR